MSAGVLRVQTGCSLLRGFSAHPLLGLRWPSAQTWPGQWSWGWAVVSDEGPGMGVGMRRSERRWRNLGEPEKHGNEDSRTGRVSKQDPEARPKAQFSLSLSMPLILSFWAEVGSHLKRSRSAWLCTSRGGCRASHLTLKRGSFSSAASHALSETLGEGPAASSRSRGSSGWAQSDISHPGSAEGAVKPTGRW